MLPLWSYLSHQASILYYYVDYYNLKKCISIVPHNWSKFSTLESGQVRCDFEVQLRDTVSTWIHSESANRFTGSLHTLFWICCIPVWICCATPPHAPAHIQDCFSRTMQYPPGSSGKSRKQTIHYRSMWYHCRIYQYSWWFQQAPYFCRWQYVLLVSHWDLTKAMINNVLDRHKDIQRHWYWMESLFFASLDYLLFSLGS